MGKRMNNSFCVICRGTDYLISDNEFVDFGYGSIGLGVWYKSEKTDPSCGIVEANTIYYTELYKEHISNHAIMDGGAIYLWTKNDGVIIRNNLIYNYSGIKDNRGIFCDDGAFNIQIYGNIITNIENSYCIDSRRAKYSEESQTAGTGIARSNIGVCIRDNIIDGRIRFEGNENIDNGCEKGTNYFLSYEGMPQPQSSWKNIADWQEDVRVDYLGSNQLGISVSRSGYRKLKKSKVWNSIKNKISK